MVMMYWNRFSKRIENVAGSGFDILPEDELVAFNNKVERGDPFIVHHFRIEELPKEHQAKLKKVMAKMGKTF